MFEDKKYVYEVYRCGSFSKAAANLYISQPALSATIKKIETRLGRQLFDRSVSPVQLTEYGQKYIYYTEQLMEMESEFESYTNDLDELRTGHLFVGGSNIFASFILPPLLYEFMKKYPGVDVRMVEANTSGLEDQIYSGKLDLIIDNNEHPGKGFDRFFFCKENLMMAVPASFPANRELAAYQVSYHQICRERISQVPICPDLAEAFKDEYFLFMRTGNDTRARSDLFLRRAGITPKVLLRVDQQSTGYHVACSGMAITFVADTLIKNSQPDPRVVYYRLDPDIAERNIYFYCKHTRYLTRAVRIFLKESCPQEGSDRRSEGGQ